MPICVPQAKTPLDLRAGAVGRARTADHHIIVRAGSVFMLSSVSGATPELIEESHSSSFQPSRTAQPPVFHSARRRSARGNSGSLRARRH
jgi:hypothetical protein